MRSKGFEGMTCPIAGVMGALGDRWGALIIRDLVFGLRRYEDFRRSSGITNATLSDRLKALEENGLIERRQYQERPKRFEYQLTGRGKDLALVLHAMADVGEKWNLAGLDGPSLRFMEKRSGRPVKVAVIDAKTGERMRTRDLTVKPGPAADELTTWRLSKLPA
jgi:DNA-binding HxlR family transcriptional regulator